MSGKVNLIKIEAVIDPLKFNKAKRCLDKIGIKDIRVSDIIEVKDGGRYPFIHNDSKFPFKLISRMKIDLTTSEDNLELVLTAITNSIKFAKINISKFITTGAEKSVNIYSENQHLEDGSYLNN